MHLLFVFVFRIWYLVTVTNYGLYLYTVSRFSACDMCCGRRLYSDSDMLQRLINCCIIIIIRSL